ncbi:hypothetical protein MTO96_049435 [Rhipicephalus appendiculatus]
MLIRMLSEAEQIPPELIRRCAWPATAIWTGAAEGPTSTSCIHPPRRRGTHDGLPRSWADGSSCVDANTLRAAAAAAPRAKQSTALVQYRVPGIPLPGDRLRRHCRETTRGDNPEPRRVARVPSGWDR